MAAVIGSTLVNNAAFEAGTILAYNSAEVKKGFGFSIPVCRENIRPFQKNRAAFFSAPKELMKAIAPPLARAQRIESLLA